MQIKQKSAEKTMEGVVQTINVRATLRQMARGTAIWLEGVNENTLRNTCTKLKEEGCWSVDKKKNPNGFLVTRWG